MATIIIYYSYTGNNKHLAEDMQKRLGCDIQEIVETRDRRKLSIFLDIIFRRKAKLEMPEVDFSKYDHIIFAAPIWASGIATPLRTYLKDVWEEFKEYSFMTICLGSEGIEEKVRAQLLNMIGREPKALCILKYNSLLPAEQKNSLKAANEYRITDEDYKTFDEQIKEFLDELN